MYLVQLMSEEGPNTELSWLLYVVLGFFLLMVIVGWLTSRRNDGQVEAARADGSSVDDRDTAVGADEGHVRVPAHYHRASM